MKKKYTYEQAKATGGVFQYEDACEYGDRFIFIPADPTAKKLGKSDTVCLYFDGDKLEPLEEEHWTEDLFELSDDKITVAFFNE